MRYICEFCNRVFSRKVTLKKHMEQHENVMSGAESGESDGELAVSPLPKDNNQEMMDITTEENSVPQDNAA